jgi:hypothetical protein
MLPMFKSLKIENNRITSFFKNLLMYKNLLTSAMYLLKKIYAQNWKLRFMKITI